MAECEYFRTRKDATTQRGRMWDTIDPKALEVHWPASDGSFSKTHGNQTVPNFDHVFSQKKVRRIDIVIPYTRWNCMMYDMQGLHGPQRAPSAPGGPAGRPAAGDVDMAFTHPSCSLGRNKGESAAPQCRVGTGWHFSRT